MNHRRKTLWKAACLALALLMAGAAWAAAPPSDNIGFQGFLTDASGTPVDDASLNMTAGIYDASGGGALLYEESHGTVTVSEGQFDLLLGAGTPASGTWDDLDFTQELWIEITAGDQTLSPRIPMSSVSHARCAFTLADGSASAVRDRNSDADASGNAAARSGGRASERISTADGYYAVAMGEGSTASGDYSTAMGAYTDAGGWGSTAMGYETAASGNVSTAMGHEAVASGPASTAMGYSTAAGGDASTAMGHSTAAGGWGWVPRQWGMTPLPAGLLPRQWGAAPQPAELFPRQWDITPQPNPMPHWLSGDLIPSQAIV